MGFTQGKSKTDAMQALADAFEDVVNRRGFTETVTALGGDVSSRNAYARYGYGTLMPKLDTVQEILKAVAPELTLTVGPRKGPTAADAQGQAALRGGAV